MQLSPASRLSDRAAMFEERMCIVGDLALNFAQGPNHGPPLVLLHGVTRAWQDFVPLAAGLSARHQLYALDFRGHGRSGRAAGDYLVSDYVQDAVALLKTELREPAIVYGHSLGAMVAAAAAAEVPECVRGLVLEDPPFDTLGSRIRDTSFHAYFAGLSSLLQESWSVPRLTRALMRLPIVSPDGKRQMQLGEVRDATALRFSAHCLT